MLDIKWVLQNFETVKAALQARNANIDLDQIKSLNEERVELQIKFDELRALQNQKSKEIGLLKRDKKDATQVIAEMHAVAQEVKDLGTEQSRVQDQLKGLMLTIPNVPHESVPVGSSEADNQQVREWGVKRDFSFKPLEHWELGEKLGGLDFERAAKIAGARFALLRGPMAKLERALAHFMLELHTKEHGYEEIIPPYLVNAEALIGTGQLPKFEADLFKTNHDYYLIPTAEVPVTNIFSAETLALKDLPYKFCAFTPCFRSEAGSHGKDVKGLIRQHQFHKVELVKLTTPETSQAELEALTKNAEKVLELLKLPFRTVVLCTGDMGFGSVKTYDIEVWLPGQNAYREISSCSSCGDFQARRMNTRFKDASGKMQFVHTLNGSGLAVGRTLIAVLENYQNEDGSITVPEVLQDFMGCDRIA